MKAIRRILSLSLVSASILAVGVQAEPNNTENSDGEQADFLDAAMLKDMGVRNALSNRVTIAGEEYNPENPDQRRRSIDFVYGLGANFVSRFQDDEDGNDPANRSEVRVDLGLDIRNANDARVLEQVMIELGLSFQDTMSDLVDSDFEGVYSTGLTEVRARDVLNKLMILANVYTIHGMGDWEIPLYVGIGRDDASAIGSFIPQTLLVTESAFTTYSREQMDQIRVAAKIGNDTYIEANIYGKQWLGDYTTGTLDGLSQDADGTNFAINVLHNIAVGKNRIGLKVSYIHEEEGTILTRATDADQLGENQTINFGANFTRKIEVGTLYIGAEALYIDPSDSDEIWGLSTLAALELDSGITPFAAIELFDRDNSTDWAATLGAAFQVVQGLVLSAGVQFIEMDEGDSDTAFFVGASLGSSAEQVVLGARE